MKQITITITALVTDKAWDEEIESRCQTSSGYNELDKATKTERYTYIKGDERAVNIAADLDEQYAEIISSKIEVADAKIEATK